LNGQVADLRHLINRLLRPPRSMTPLDLAWQRFALYDLNAARQQKHFKRLKNAAIVLGVVSTILTLTFTGLKEVFTDFEISWLGLALRLLVIVVPIATSLLLAADTRFKPGSKWTLLRAGSEEIKRAIFYYRARPDIPDDRSPVPATHEARLDQQVETVSRRLMRTDVNEAALHPYTGPIPPKMYGAAADDDGISKLSPERYITIRLGDQINFFQLKTNQLEKRLRRFQIWILVYGGMGAFLAAVGAVLWIPIAVTVVAGLTAYLEYQQVEQTLKHYNQVSTDLANVQSWWMALPDDEQKDRKKVNTLVDFTETILATESTGWVQQMQNALAKLREGEDGDEDDTAKNQLMTRVPTGQNGAESASSATVHGNTRPPAGQQDDGTASTTAGAQDDATPGNP